MPKETKTVATQPGEEENFIRKAQDFLGSAQRSWTEGNHQSTAVLAIHCTISSCDAVTAKLLSRRHKGENHLDVVDLLKTLPVRDRTELNNRIRQVKALLVKKTQAEYESKLIRKDDVKTMLDQAVRIYNWAHEIVNA